MEVLSTNISEPTEITWNGKKEFTGIFKKATSTSIFLGETDVEGDSVIERKYHGGLDMATYLYSEKWYSFWKNLYPNLDWQFGMFGENLTVSDFDESKVFIGNTYQIGEAIIQVSQIRQPCYKLGIRFENPKIIKQFFNSPYPGAYFRVLKTGNVQTGDKLILIEEAQNSMSLADVFSLFTKNKNNQEMLSKALQINELAHDCKESLRKLLKD